MALAASFDATSVAGTAANPVQQRVAVRFALAVLQPARIPPDAHFKRANARGPNSGHVAAA